ncbi:TadE/TadG family type IV pilus assembly protein [Brevundimonas sp.]|uniref:TadE/TadG family type IV pilus assembly protein n=1 Tax=Brevundimonas sp. TaxID=1871086 RepID=UPI003BAAF3D5
MMIALAGLVKRFHGDRRGVSAVEFALIAPVMILFYFGLAELCQAYMAQRRMSHVASAVADMVAQADVLTKDQLADITAIGPWIMKPFSAATLTTKITSVTRDANGSAKADWSVAHGPGATAWAKHAVIAVPADTIVNGESLVMVETSVVYESPVKYVVKKATTLSSTFYLRPRRVDTVGCSDC